MADKNKIHILPDHVMKRIAAGEVVERPASVAKELIENALDANADRISILIKGSGLDLVQAVDNGDGMSEEDALLCCERHATSKISVPEDLEAIDTYGFRGEALASIGSVARMVIATRTDRSEEATQVLVEHGRILEVMKTSAPKGTSVEVKDLFAAVPARRKFLKTPATELRHLLSVFRRTALSRPEAEFTLFIDDQKTLDLRKGSLEERIRDLWGDEKASVLVPVHQEMGGITIRGFVCKPTGGMRSRDDQFFYLNRRFIVNKSLSHAVYSSYGPRLGADGHPMYILFLEMEARRFDVNVHPTKIEVRFSDERYLHDSMKKAVQDALRRPTAVPEFQLVVGKAKSEFPSFADRTGDRTAAQLTLDMQRPPDERSVFQSRKPDTTALALWQLHNRYILSQIKSGLTIIDQHVAHERILYEKALRSIESRAGNAQQLLFPQTVQLPPEDYLVLTEILPYLEKIGFGLKDFGGNTLIVEAVPVDVRPGREKEVFFELIEEFKHSRQGCLNLADSVAKSYACKSAIKSGDRLNLSEMVSLIDQLFATNDPYVCPHGRPIVVNLTLEEIDKRFGR